MEHPGFFERAQPVSIAELAAFTDTSLATDRGAEIGGRTIVDVRALSEAGADHVSFLDNQKYLGQLKTTRAGACFVSERTRADVPAHTIALVAANPYRAFARALALFYPEARRSKVAHVVSLVGELAGELDSERALGPAIHPSAHLEDGVEIEPNVVVGPQARIGRGTRLSAGAVVGYRVYIGRDCFIGPQATITHALIGDRVIIHAGARLGQDGFGFAMGKGGHLKVPQIGRVIVQDDVEIGANTAIDRGALKDTIIGEGTKIDNLVQIGHNAVLGRHCVIAGMAAIAGSVELEDYIVMGGQSGLAGHIKVGVGAQVAAASHVNVDMKPGTQYLGTPGKPLKSWAREQALIKRVIDAEESRPKSKV